MSRPIRGMKSGPVSCLGGGLPSVPCSHTDWPRRLPGGEGTRPAVTSPVTLLQGKELGANPRGAKSEPIPTLRGLVGREAGRESISGDGISTQTASPALQASLPFPTHPCPYTHKDGPSPSLSPAPPLTDSHLLPFSNLYNLLVSLVLS